MLGNLFVIWYCSVAVDASGILYPRDSESREVNLLNGVWQFRLEDIPGEGVSNEWYAQKMTLSSRTQSMPVPSSYNDLPLDARYRDHVGVVWYDRTFYVPKYWHGLRVWIRFSSVNYLATVWVNGQYITTHEFGALPFQTDVTSVLNYGHENLITVSVNNTLTVNTIPSGDLQEIETSNGTIIRQSYPLYYFNYSGIDGQVFIYTTPTLYVDDITLITDINESTDILTKHEQYLTELIQRDKNRPSVIMWSIGNQLPAGEDDDNYYGSVVDHIKSLDGIRPVTGPLSQFNLYKGNVAQYLDILGISASYGWDTYPGVLDAIEPAMLKELEAWQEKCAKPLFMMVYGADAMSGTHTYPEWPWSEEYQISLLSRYFEVFDIVRNRSNAFIGELTSVAVGQDGAIKNGVITKQRQPKCAAPLVRRRYYHLANQLDGEPLPEDLETYVALGVGFRY